MNRPIRNLTPYDQLSPEAKELRVAARRTIEVATMGTADDVPRLDQLVEAMFAGILDPEPQDGAVLRGARCVWVRDDASMNGFWFELTGGRAQAHARRATWFRPGEARGYTWAEVWFLERGDTPEPTLELIAQATPTGPGRHASNDDWERWHAARNLPRPEPLPEPAPF